MAQQMHFFFSFFLYISRLLLFAVISFFKLKLDFWKFSLCPYIFRVPEKGLFLDKSFFYSL